MEMGQTLKHYEEAQRHEANGYHRAARDAYRRAGATRSAREMHARYQESLQDELVEQMIRALARKES